MNASPIAALLAAIALAGTAFSDSLPQPARGVPNILFILADDLGWRDCSSYGSTFHETPNIDGLARRGMRFTEAYAASPLCSPTRASILTGQWPGRLRLTTPACHLPQEVLEPTLPAKAAPHRKAVTPGTRTRLPNDYHTIAEELQDAGYTTAFMGKWHLGRAPYLPENQGFDLVVGGRHHPGPPAPGYFGPWKGVPTLPDVPKGTHIDDVLGDQALKFLETRAAGEAASPFCLFLWFYGVHAPFEGKPGLISRYEGKIAPGNPQRCPTMGAMIETMDHNIGRVLAKLDELALTKDTLIVFTSDNGGNMYNRVKGVTPTSNAPLRSGKGNAYEGGCRVPLVVSWPGTVEPDSLSAEITSSVDWFPTLLEITGRTARPEQVLDGISLLPALQGQPLQRDAIFCHFPHYVKATGNLPVTWVRQGDWKLLRYFADSPAQTDRLELYNLDEDIGESRNLAHHEPGRAAALNSMVGAHLAATRSLVPIPNPAYRANAPIKGWRAGRDATLTLRENHLLLTSAGRDPMIICDQLPPANGVLQLEFRLASKAGGNGMVFWRSKGQPYFRSRHKDFPIKLDGAFHDYLVEFQPDPGLRGLRIDPGAEPGQIRIEWIRLRNVNKDLLKEWRFAK